MIKSTFASEEDMVSVARSKNTTYFKYWNLFQYLISLELCWEAEGCLVPVPVLIADQKLESGLVAGDLSGPARVRLWTLKYSELCAQV